MNQRQLQIVLDHLPGYVEHSIKKSEGGRPITLAVMMYTPRKSEFTIEVPHHGADWGATLCRFLYEFDKVRDQ